MDRVTPEVRSRIMSRIRGRDTIPELLLKPVLERHGFDHLVEVEGITVDFAHFGRRIALFVDGCFWHGCPLHYREPRSNVWFWRLKLERNQERDKAHNRRLEQAGWRVIRIWEHQVKGAK